VFDDVSRAFTQTNKRLPPHVGREVWDNAVESPDRDEML
jgi:hypothetical protein